MTNRPKQKGTRFETMVARYLKSQGIECERKALTGAADEGDLKCVIDGKTGVIECKAHEKITRSLCYAWMQETREELSNTQADFALLIIKRPRHGIHESWVVFSDYSSDLVLLPTAHDTAWVIEIRQLMDLLEQEEML